jgi:hypothetical protein
VEDRLAKIGAVLAQFEARTDIQSLVPVQPLFTEARRHVHYYAAGDTVRPPPLLSTHVHMHTSGRMRSPIPRIHHLVMH